MVRQTKTPAQRKRNAYAAAVRARGASGHNLWFVVPPLDPPDPPLTLMSDVELECYLFLEGAPDLVTIDYSPLRGGGERPLSGLRHFATVTTLHGHRIEVDLDPAGTGARQPGRRIIDVSTLDSAKLRIRSWRSITAAINRCRTHELTPLIFRCRHVIEEQPHISLISLLDQVPEPSALVAGALGSMLRSRELESDVDEHLWGGATKVWPRANG